MQELPFWTVAGLRERAGVSVVTLRRWKRTGRLPRWAIILVAILSGELEQVDPAFAGWLIRAGELISPEGWRFTPGEIRSIPFLYGQVRLWRDEALTYRNTPQQRELALEEPRHDDAYPNCRRPIVPKRGTG
ncbi:MAG: DUF3653 domain-containing protein [Planctomycetota bacterium]